MSRSPSLVRDEKAMYLPSRDQAGAELVRLVLVRRSGLLPLESISQISQVSRRSEMNAICLPSGDHSGSISFAGLSVRSCSFLPSASMTKISHLVRRSVIKAICLPSGDQIGKRLADRSFVIRFSLRVSRSTL